MIKIAICDDEMAYVEKIATLVTKSFEKEKFSLLKFDDGEKLLETDIVSYDLIFLDVDMKNLNGIDVAKQIRKCNKKVLLVYISAYLEYATFGYEVMAFRYLLKPTLDKTFNDCMVAVKEKIHSQNEKVLIKADKGYVKILINDILYIESCNRKLMVYLINEKEPHIYYDKLDDIDVKLQNKGFLRVQKSYLINMEHTMKISNYVATLKNGVLVSTKKEGYAPMRDTFIQWKGAM